MILIMYILCGFRENVIYKNKIIWINLFMKLNIVFYSLGKLKKNLKFFINFIRFYFIK